MNYELQNVRIAYNYIILFIISVKIQTMNHLIEQKVNKKPFQLQLQNKLVKNPQKLRLSLVQQLYNGICDLELFSYLKKRNQNIKVIKTINTKEQLRFQIDLSKKLGSGGYGDCYIAQDCIKDKKVAIKILKNSIQKTQRFQNEFLAKFYNNPNIVQSYCLHLPSRTNFYIVMQYCNMGTLRDIIDLHIKNQKHFSQLQINQIMQDILNGYKHLYELGVVHQDLKPSNILINDNIFKIGDFGLTCKVGTEYKRLRGTKYYVSLQKFKVKHQNKPSSHLSDIYSLGIILFQMLYEGKHPYRAKAFQEYNKKKKQQFNKYDIQFYGGQWLQIAKIEKPQNSKASKIYSKQLLDLVNKMIYHNPKQRPDFLQVYEFFMGRKSKRQSYQIKIIKQQYKKQQNQIKQSILIPQEISKSQSSSSSNHILGINDITNFLEKRRYIIKYLDKIINPFHALFGQRSPLFIKKQYLLILKEIKQKMIEICYLLALDTYQKYKKMRQKLSKKQIPKFHCKMNEMLLSLLIQDMTIFKSSLPYNYQSNKNLSTISAIAQSTKSIKFTNLSQFNCTQSINSNLKMMNIGLKNLLSNNNLQDCFDNILYQIQLNTKLMLRVFESEITYNQKNKSAYFILIKNLKILIKIRNLKNVLDEIDDEDFNQIFQKQDRWKQIIAKHWLYNDKNKQIDKN